jgi:YihY family inner membrane protein
VANAAQHALNRVWDVPVAERPGFVPRVARSLGLIATIGFGVLVTTLIATAGGVLSSFGTAGRVLVVLAVIVLQIALFVVAFNMLTTADIGWRAHVPGAIPAGIIWQLFATFGGLYINHGLKGMSQTYGMFAIVIGMLTWIYLQAQVVLYAAEINVVHARRLWPRSLSTPPPAGGDVKARDALAAAEAQPGDSAPGMPQPVTG